MRNELPLMLVATVVTAVALVFGVPFLRAQVVPAAAPPAQDNPDKARFMLECHYDYGVPVEDCTRMLRGESPRYEYPPTEPRC